MIRDPLYRQIIERLNGPLDPELFEQCVADLLRAIYPTLVPIRGGSDAGMDGAIADGLGEPFPLVATTSERVLENVTRNLNAYLADGRPRRKVVLATSQSLTTGRRKNLHRRAGELGFTLVQIYDQDATANLLYRSPEWCHELLGLSGTPPALSAIPRTQRPLLDVPLVGREADLEWLRQTSGDRLLVGQPGSGKTFLLYKLAVTGAALFVNDPDRSQIAAGLRAHQPAALIVDDAQNHCDLLLALRQMRAELGVDFSIIASCWPGGKDTVTEALNLGAGRTIELELLTRDEIVQVINGAGVYGPDGLVREIVDQAEGRPGRAVTLTQISLRGDVRDLALGVALSRSVLTFFGPVVGREASAILAAFAVGGDAGMTMQAVAKALGLALFDVRDAVVRLAAGGVITEHDEKRLSVRPPALRHALIRDFFFRGASSYPIEPVLGETTNFEETVLTLVGAKRRGATIPYNLLTSLVEGARSDEVWKAYAWLGRDEAYWVVQRHPDMVIAVARPALYHVPESVIPLLLTAAVGDQRQLHSTTEHPLRLIHDWVRDARRGTGEPVRRRCVLLDSIEAWLSNDGDSEVGLRALQSVLTPAFEYHTTDPGSGQQFTIIYGCITDDEMRAVQSLWPRALNVIGRSGWVGWGPIREIVEDWAYPQRLGVELPPDHSDLMRSFASQMLLDLVEVFRGRPGTVRWADELARQLGADLQLPRDEVFEILYPPHDYDDWRAAMERQVLRVQELAAEWGQLQPSEVARRIAQVEEEERSAGIAWPRYTPLLCAEIAAKTPLPSRWIRAMIDAGCTPDLIEPFVRRAPTVNDPDGLRLAKECLERPDLRRAAIVPLLSTVDPPEELLEKALTNLQGFGPWITTACVRGEIPEQLVKRLLNHDDPAIASAAAEGEWQAEARGTVRASLESDWEEAVLRETRGVYWLRDVFIARPPLAYRWLEARLSDDTLEVYRGRDDSAVGAAVSVLDAESRRRLLPKVPAGWGFDALVAGLVDDDLDLYGYLLTNEELKQYHFAPLAGQPEGLWVEKARMALDAGYSSEEVAYAVYGYPMGVSWSGNESAMRAEWMERFEQLCSSEDDRIREVGKAGRAAAKQAYDKAARRERREAIYGRR